MNQTIYKKEYKLPVKGSEGIIDERNLIDVWPLAGDRVGIYLREYFLMQNGAFHAASNQVCIPNAVARELCHAILAHIGDIK